MAVKGLSKYVDDNRRLNLDGTANFRDLGLKTSCDLRSDRERQRSPDRLPATGALRYLFLPVEDRKFDPATALERLKNGDREWLSLDFVIGIYRCYLDDYGLVWGKILTLATADSNLPLVFHCPGGKDRTGVCAALGVEPEMAVSYLQAPVEPLAAMLEYLKTSYGNVEEYLLKRAHMEGSALSSLRTNLLQ
jgi:protein tyrosine/serine phosphatase